MAENAEARTRVTGDELGPRSSGKRPPIYLGSAARRGLSPWLIVDSISDVVEVIDNRGIIIYSNLPEIHRRRLSLDPVQGRKCHQVYDKICGSCLRCPLEDVLRDGASLTRETQVELGDGRRGWTRQHLYPIRNQAGSIKAVLRMVFDITAEKRSRIRQERYLSVLEQSLVNREVHGPDHPAQPLSSREREVLSFLADGMSNHEIARLLNISPNTVKTHVVHIFNKLGVNDRTQAAVTALRLQLI